MPFIDYVKIRDLVPIEHVLQAHGWRPTTRWGGVPRGQCPLGCKVCRCPPFVVQPARKLWNCFRCHRYGDVVALWALLTDQYVYPAALDLCRRFHLEVPSK